MSRQIALATGLVLIIIAGALGVGYWASRTPEPVTLNTNTATKNAAVTTNASVSNSANTQQSTTSNTSTDTNNSSYSLDTVANHAVASDCWLVIENKVYDVTKYIPEHPGGKRITQGCGKDATDLFTGKSSIGRMHSAIARKALAKYHIGTLE